MSSEFTIDIQLTELGFTSWDLPLCQPPSGKETSSPPPTESPASVSETTPTSESPSPRPNNDEDRGTVGCAHQYRTRPANSAQEKAVQIKQQRTLGKDSSSGAQVPRHSKIPVQAHSGSGKTCKTPQSQSSKHVTTIRNDFGIDIKTSVLQSSVATSHSSKAFATQNDEVQDEGSKEGRDGGNRQDDVEGRQESAGTEWNGTDELQKDGDESDDSEVSEEEDDDDEDDEDNDDEEDVVSSEMDASGEHRCYVCDVTFPSMFLLQEHMHVHNGVRPYCCAECNKQFCHLANYRAHLRTHAVSPAIRCLVCQASFDTEEHLQVHLENNHFEKEFYQCDFCKRIFTCIIQCELHVEKHKREAEHQCPKCRRHFRLRRSLRRHVKHRRCYLTYSCTDCGQSFGRKDALLRHSFTHLGLLPYTCVVCKCHFRLASLYRKHKCKPERIQCVACLGVFQSQNDFDKHKKDTGCWGYQGARPTGNRDEIRCMECGQAFNNPEELKKHAGTHQRVLKCAECGMGFRSKLMLMSHMGGHAGQRPCLCQDCGLGFPHQQAYDSHLKDCGTKPHPVAETQKKKQKTRSAQVTNKIPIAPRSLSFPGTSVGTNYDGGQILSANQPQEPSEGVWKLTLNKQPPPGVPLIMFLPVPTTVFSDSSVQSSGLVTETQQNPSQPQKLICSADPASIPPTSPTEKSASNQCVNPVSLIDNTKSAIGNPSGNVLIPLKNESSDKKRWTVLGSEGPRKSAVDNEVIAQEEKRDMKAVTLETSMETERKKEVPPETDSLIDVKRTKALKDDKDTDLVHQNAVGSPRPAMSTLQIKKEGVEECGKRDGSKCPSDVDSRVTEIDTKIKMKKEEEREMKGPQDPTDVTLESLGVKNEPAPWNAVKEERDQAEILPHSKLKTDMDLSLKTGMQTEFGSQSCVAVQRAGTEAEEDLSFDSVEVELGEEHIEEPEACEEELHECVTCGKILLESDMVQHYMQHAVESDCPVVDRTSKRRTSMRPTSKKLPRPSPPPSPPSKRLRSGTRF